ncbi:response regulator transcription factor [Nitrospirillum sp. BR 11164]|uniref:response regulator transcription factor n=1 Tax=Nitrospirillum sp. BR 11164 TaxID=3104324 RepID=UPI002AFFF946|nr:response regulator transcription factor [Nitrospirillum sp. BR 11164]MEA1647456.1 response regulator transcription factor [Nitrospirillum sp. BR 11164]
MHRILVVDDDPHIRDVLCFALEKAGMAAEWAGNGVDALDLATRNPPSLVVLDVGMPEMDGLEVCRRLRRASDVPILFLSARDEEIDRVLGLEMGGDDYVTKPFSPRELVARVNVILRRARGTPQGASPGAALVATPQEDAPPLTPPPIIRGALVLDSAGHRATVAGRELGLTAREFMIVKTLAGRPAVVFSRNQLMDAAYPDNIHVSDRTIDSHVRNIRAKFQAAGCEDVVETVHGVGFRLGPCTTGTAP